MKRLVAAAALLALSVVGLPAQVVPLPVKPGSVRFAAIGDMGTGQKPQYEVAAQMVESRRTFPFDFVIMLGDNIYGSNNPSDYVAKFEAPYKPLLNAGVLFYASLGNHDSPAERLYKPFNMNGAQYYAFKKENVQFFALDSNYMDSRQLSWLEKELQGSGADWKICYFHHPLYSSGGFHGPATQLRALIEPLFVKYGVQVVFAGHEHFYERVKPQQGVTYFTSGGGGQLREGNIRPSPATAAGYDQDRSFMLVEIAGDDLHFQAVSRTGKTVDSGVIERANKAKAVSLGTP